MIEVSDEQYRLHQVQRLRAIVSATLDSSALIVEEDALTLVLQRRGFAPEQIRATAALSYTAVLQICGFLRNPEYREPIKLLLTAIAHAKTLPNEFIRSVKRILPAIKERPPRHVDQLARLLRIDSKSQHRETKFLHHFIARGIYPRSGNLLAYMREDMKKFPKFEKLVDLDAQWQGVHISEIEDGAGILREGEVMNHCLSDMPTSYSRFIDCVDGALRVFHLSLEKNNVQCCTLSISRGLSGRWTRCECESVGRGSPPKLLLNAATYIENAYNLKFLGTTSPDLGDDFPDFNFELDPDLGEEG